MKQDYLDIFEGVKSDVRCNMMKNSDIQTTYLGMPKMRRHDESKTGHKAPITEDWYIPSNLLDGTVCKIWHDTGASKSVTLILLI